MIVSKIRGVRVGEVWFDEEPNFSGVDVLRYYRRSTPFDGIPFQESWTILVDLTKDENYILTAFKRDTRYEVKRAGTRDPIIYYAHDVVCPSVVSHFCDFYDRFAAQKGLPRARRRCLQSLAGHSALDCSEVRTHDGETLGWHVFLKGKHRVRLLHSPSLFREHLDSDYRNMIGRANRYHHWRDMLRFKSEGVALYDLGGWYAGDTDRENIRVCAFKEGFGGRIVRTYDFQQPATRKGKLALWLREALLRRRPGVDLVSILALGGAMDRLETALTSVQFGDDRTSVRKRLSY
jgi:hypothetical protein